MVTRTCIFEVTLPLGDVITFLSEPRNLIHANNAGPVLEQSDGPVRAGWWSVLALDQLRVRVEYTVFEPPDVVEASMTWTGPGSRGLEVICDYYPWPIAETGGTRVTLMAHTSGGPIQDVVSRLLWPLQWRRIRRRMNFRGRQDACR